MQKCQLATQQVDSTFNSLSHLLTRLLPPSFILFLFFSFSSVNFRQSLKLNRPRCGTSKGLIVFFCMKFQNRVRSYLQLLRTYFLISCFDQKKVSATRTCLCGVSLSYSILVHKFIRQLLNFIIHITCLYIYISSTRH